MRRITRRPLSVRQRWLLQRTYTNAASALALERLDRALFRAMPASLWRPPGARGVYGGQIFGQAMLAGHLTLSNEMHAEMALHSAHANFLLPGDSRVPILYDVDAVRDGRSFATRSVKAIQNGRAILTATMSFHAREESVEHEEPMPEVPRPEDLPDTRARMDTLLQDSRLSDVQRAMIVQSMQRPVPLDVRHVNWTSPLDARPQKARQFAWIRAHFAEEAALSTAAAALVPSGSTYSAAQYTESLKTWSTPTTTGSSAPLSSRGPSDSATPIGVTSSGAEAGPEAVHFMHRCIVAYASDWSLCTASLLPHGLSLISPRLGMLASLDHSMWFHRPFRADQWMLYEMTSPVATGARSLNFGRLYDGETGRLCVSVAQEALLRAKPEPM